MVPIVTIDGPSGSGKGTISKSLALELGWNYLDSGLIYRCYAFLHLSKVSNIPDEIKKILGKHSNEIEKILGYVSKSEVIHKDDMVEII